MDPVPDLPLIAERVAHVTIQVELVLQPQQPSLEERRKPAAGDPHVSLEKSARI
jgi:hypothetical protein